MRKTLAIRFESRPPKFGFDRDMTQTQRPDEHAMNSIVIALYALKDGKPNDRSEKDRFYAVAITEAEKLLAYFRQYIFQEGNK